ncbi:MAG: class I SAM-dependent methyltransferase [Desulfuromonadales bacterium]|nr:class I SAM-dependent methyltransferase [Desulfuromonadales bacterium]
MRNIEKTTTQSGLSNEKYFEKREVWAELTEGEQRRIEETLALLPEDVDGILNIGCGDGRVTRTISERHRIVGVDLSFTALKLFHDSAAVGSIDALPFRDRSVDLALVTEVLEHLPQPIYDKALQEVQRVADRYILITVPYKEVLEANFLRCHQCDLLYHAWNHLRTFSRSNTSDLLKGFSVVAATELGLKTPNVPRWMYKLLHSLGKTWSESSSSLCPRCGASHQPRKDGNLFGSFWKRVVWRLYDLAPVKRSTFIGILYQREKG